MKSYEIDYIMTRKVNQDIIENLFSFLKGMCGSSYNNITALQFKYWYVIIKYTKHNK